MGYLTRERRHARYTMKLQEMFPPGLLVVGVTGHRELEDSDRPMLERAVQECLQELERSRSAGSCRLLCGLAAGADQLAAQCALDRGWELHAVLASPADEFALTLPNRDAYRLLHTFLPRCAEVSVVASQSPSCEHDYEGVARTIVRHADELVALWDGSPSRGLGGTAHTLKWFLEGGHDIPSVNSGMRRALWIKTRRLGDPGLLPEQPSWRWLSSEELV
jgi:hypothetical protein